MLFYKKKKTHNVHFSLPSSSCSPFRIVTGGLDRRLRPLVLRGRWCLRCWGIQSRRREPSSSSGDRLLMGALLRRCFLMSYLCPWVFVAGLRLGCEWVRSVSFGQFEWGGRERVMRKELQVDRGSWRWALWRAWVWLLWYVWKNRQNQLLGEFFFPFGCNNTSQAQTGIRTYRKGWQRTTPSLRLLSPRNFKPSPFRMRYGV